MLAVLTYYFYLIRFGIRPFSSDSGIRSSPCTILCLFITGRKYEIPDSFRRQTSGRTTSGWVGWRASRAASCSTSTPRWPRRSTTPTTPPTSSTSPRSATARAKKVAGDLLLSLCLSECISSENWRSRRLYVRRSIVLSHTHSIVC